MKSITAKIERLATQIQHCLVAVVFMGVCQPFALAQDGHTHAPKPTQSATALDQQNALIKIVRSSTEQFKDVSVAEAAGYALQFGCVSGDDFGAMGLHY